MRISSAIAPAFTFTAHTFTFELLGVPATIYTASVTGGTRYVNVGPSASDLVRLVAVAMNAAPGLPGGVSFAATMGADGKVSITCTGDTWATTTLDTTLAGRVLGFHGSGFPYGTFQATQTASAQPMYLALFVGLAGGVWSPRQGGGVEETAGGVVFSFGSTTTSYRREVNATFIPRDPTEAALVGTTGTPMWPDDAYHASIGVTSVGRAWSLLDVFSAARNSPCNISISQWDTLRADTTTKFRVGYLGRGTLLSPAIERQSAVWDRFVSHTLHLVSAAAFDDRA